MRTTCLCLALVAGCNGSPMMPPPPALPLCSAAIPTGATASTSSDPALADAAACTEASSSIQLAAAADIAPSGFTALGKAVAFSGAAGPFPHNLDFVVPCDLAKGPAGAPQTRIAVAEKRGDGNVIVTPVANVVYEAPYRRLHFHGDELGTYQCVIPSSAGQTVTRHYTYRALAGPSMGGIGSSVNFWLHPDRYDALAVMGADPGPDLTYTLGTLQDWFFAGFCTADDQAAGRGNIGQLCPAQRKAMTDQGEVSFDYEHMPTQTGEGIGLTLKRSFYLRAFRDLSRALGNAAYATAPGASTYLPPGVDPSTIALTPAMACAQPTVLKNFYDARFNPDGSKDVITVCDGGDSNAQGAKGYGVFDPTLPQTDPGQIILAVDLNGNGKRDSGEPVIQQGAEPWRDVGTDGLADKDEPGYDPATNPDPNHDDYHWRHNPGGTENNWTYDMGEPFDDFGVDGVQGKGCTVGTSAGCYDYGEGNGKFDWNGNLANWYAHDPHRLADALTDDAFNRVDIYYDAGMRDFLNDEVSTNTLMSVLHRKGQHVRVFEGFPALVGASPSAEDKFDVTNVDFKATLGRRAYVRYGDPDANQSAVEQTGDGRHVGTPLQAVHRAQMLFYYLGSVWPDPDLDINAGAAPDLINDTFTAANGRVTPYTVVLPPGYDDPANAGKRYPIAYVMHGLGMKPADLGMIGVVAQSAMVNEKKPLQKFIVVIADGECLPGGDVSQAPLPTTGDLCEEGAYYVNHPDGSYRGEDHLLELETLIEGKYRVRAAEDKQVVQ